MRALIIIDVQNDFLPGGSLEVPGSHVIIPVINSIQHEFPVVIATQDWHPENHKSFASNHPGRNPMDKIILNGLEQTLWPDHCVQGTYGAEFPESLQTKKVEAIIRKGMDPDTDSYSAFFDNGHKKSTGLTGYLREKGATDLYFCGLAADICVYYSIIDALAGGFHCTLIEDATFPLDRKFYPALKDKMEKESISISSSDSLFHTKLNESKIHMNH